MSTSLCSTVRVILLAGICIPLGGVLRAQTTTRVSVDSHGGQSNGESYVSGISGDGRLIVFVSRADNLVPGDTNSWPDVFVHDRVTGETTRVSVDSQGMQSNAESETATISDDGRFVAFSSWASNLVIDDTNGCRDIFVRDLVTGETSRVSVDSNGAQAYGGSYLWGPCITPDGRYVAFSSTAPNLVLGDTNGVEDIFVHDRVTGQTTRENVSSNGVQANAAYIGPVNPAISADDRKVTFFSNATNLVPNDTNGVADVFVHDRSTGETVRVSVDSQGVQGNSESGYGTLSTDGRFVAFESLASNFYWGDTYGTYDVFVHDSLTGETAHVGFDTEDGEFDVMPEISVSGRYVVYLSNMRVFVEDLDTRQITQADVNSQGEPGNAFSEGALLSADEQFVAIQSWASNLVPGDTNELRDVFEHDLTRGPCSFAASWQNYGSGWPGTTGVPGLVAQSNPVLCGTIEVFAGNSMGSNGSALLLVGFSAANQETPWDGSLLVVPSLTISLPIPATGLSIASTIPCDDSLCGLALFVQVVEMDPGASRGISFTPGLQLRLGI